MRLIRSAAWYGLFLGFLVALPAATTGQEATSDADTGVRPGDRVEIRMFTAAGDPLEQIGGTRTVDRNGRLFLPFLGSIDVQSMGASEIRELLERRYADIYSSPVVDVQTRIRVNVTGTVRSPGNYFVEPTSTIVDVLSAAGGATSEVNIGNYGAASDPGRVRLVRGGEMRILDLRPEQADQATLNLRAQSGDWLHVPPRTRSRLRDNIQFLSSVFSLVGSVAAVVILLGR